jgi:hypothetical protein
MKHTTALVAALIAAPLAQAADFNAIGTLTQAEFLALSKDLGSVIAHKGMTPAEGLGITGFDLGVSVGATELASRDTLRKAAGGASIPTALPTASVRFVKGLPFDIDIGVVHTSLYDNNLRATSGEVRWAFVPGSTVMPAVALRVSGSKLFGAQQLDLHTVGGDVSISKGFLFITPYAGAGAVETTSRAPGTGLREVRFRQDRAFVGVNLALLPLAINVEADRTGDANTYSIKFALRW